MAAASPAIPAAAEESVLQGRTKWLVAFVLAFSNLMVVLDMTVANVSVPHIAGSMGVSTHQGTWVVTSYSVAEALVVPLTGWVARRFGTVRLYLVAMSGFTLFSLLCGLSQTLAMIVLCRIGQGLSGGFIMPISQTLLFGLFPGKDRAKAILLGAMTTLLGPALGPNIGGFISDTLSWHWVFFINVPLVIPCLLFIGATLTAHETETRKVPIDTVGLALLVIWVGCLQFMLDIGGDRDWFADPFVVGLALVAAIGFTAFLIWELTEEHPIVDLRVFRYPGYPFGVMALSLSFSSYFASIVVIPQWLQSSMGYPALAAGFITSCTALTALTTSRLAARAMERGVDPRLLVTMAIGWLGCMSLVRANWTSSADYWTLAAPQLIQGFGMAFFMMPLTAISLNSVPQSDMASATGIQNFVRTLSVGIATASALTIWSDKQQEARAEIAANLRPDDALRTLSDSGLNPQQATGMIDQLVQREVLMMATDHVFLVTAVVFFFSAAVIWLAPRPKQPAGH